MWKQGCIAKQYKQGTLLGYAVLYSMLLLLLLMLMMMIMIP